MKHGVYASFMPKPLADAPGSGMHVHQSLFDLDGNNAFFDSGTSSAESIIYAVFLLFHFHFGSSAYVQNSYTT